MSRPRSLLMALAALGCSPLGAGAPPPLVESDAPADAGGGGFPEGGIDAWSETGVGPQSCAVAEATRSYVGCEYWPTVTLQTELPLGPRFAVVAANTTTEAATITVDRGGTSVATATVAPGGLEVITLPWVDGLRQNNPGQSGETIHSVLEHQGAFHLVSSVPITLYQFSPLEFVGNEPVVCDPCFSYSADASLLLPTTALAGEYYALGWPTWHFTVSGRSYWSDIPGFTAITATEDGTTVSVVTPAHVRAGPGVEALEPGQTGSYRLDRSDVLLLATGTPPAAETPSFGKPCSADKEPLLLCPTGADYDLTGAHIVADKPVAALGGHSCSILPYSTVACDHLEETLFPRETIGKEVLVTAPAVAQLNDTRAPYFARVLSASDANTISFDPPIVEARTLNSGEWFEIGPIDQDFVARGTGRVAVGQYMVSESALPRGPGDPSLSSAVSTEQYRRLYVFLASPTFTFNFVNVLAPLGAPITLDGAPLAPAAFEPIGTSGWAVARQPVSGGRHVISGDERFGIVVYGYASYTSYMYPGGLDLQSIPIPQ